MKKILCYIAIFVLILLIVIPPVFRIIYKDKDLGNNSNNNPKPVTVINAISCSSNSQSIYMVYFNDSLTSIKYQVSLSYLEINPEIPVRDSLINENITATTTDTDEEYFVKFADINGLTDYRKDINTNKAYFESLGYICNISKY